MAGAVRFAAECESDPYQVFWAKATLGDLELLVGTPPTVTDAYKTAVAKNENDWFALNSSRAQLLLLNDLGFQPERVKAGIAVFDRALDRIPKPAGKWQPNQVILFSGHMVDAPDRAEPRFPPGKVEAAARRIGEALDALNAGPGDLALSQAAAGGDLLFLEACQKRGVRCQVLLPFPEPQFIQSSIVPSADGDTWRKRYFDVKTALQNQPAGQGPLPLRIMVDELGRLPSGVDPFERCNLWLLYTTLAWGIDKARFICLWNGGGKRWSRRHRAHEKRGRAPDRPGDTHRHAQAVSRDRSSSRRTLRPWPQSTGWWHDAVPLDIDQHGALPRTAQALPPLRRGATVYRVVLL